MGLLARPLLLLHIHGRQGLPHKLVHTAAQSFVQPLPCRLCHLQQTPEAVGLALRTQLVAFCASTLALHVGWQQQTS